MDRKQIEEKITAIIEAQIGVSDIDPSADLQKKYEVDSIGVLDFIMTVEEEFSVTFLDKDLAEMKSVQDLAQRVQELM
uniref:acyl carrier protein n=1 Tax=Ndongobacter massiliensis TaxID=1871025 RepID=UPI000930FBBD|nr:acyl carrier protein [Ndongobacter massiliensis]